MAFFGLDGKVGSTWRNTSDPVILPGVLAVRMQAFLDGANADAGKAAVETLARLLIKRQALNDGEAAAIVAGHPAKIIEHLPCPPSSDVIFPAEQLVRS